MKDKKNKHFLWLSKPLYTLNECVFVCLCLCLLFVCIESNLNGDGSLPLFRHRTKDLPAEWKQSVSSLHPLVLLFGFFCSCLRLYSDVWLCRDLLYTHANMRKKEIWAFPQVQRRRFIWELAPGTGVWCVCAQRVHVTSLGSQTSGKKKKTARERLLSKPK